MSTYHGPFLLELHLPLDVLVIRAFLPSARARFAIQVIIVAFIKYKQEFVGNLLFDLCDFVVSDEVEGNRLSQGQSSTGI
jgi:hypothetical protein